MEKLSTINKRHTFTLEVRIRYIAEGKKIIIDLQGFKILSPYFVKSFGFPVWARNTENYDGSYLFCQFGQNKK